MADTENVPALPESGTTLQSDRGKTVISDGVVSKIAGLAAREVEGVRELVATGLTQTMAGMVRAVARQQSRDTGISVEVGSREAIIDVRLCADYGVPIPELAGNVRQNIIARVEGLTGLTVKEVNVSVLDLYFAPDEVAAEAPAKRVE